MDILDIKNIPDTAIIALAQSMITENEEVFIVAGFSRERIEHGCIHIEDKIKVLEELLFDTSREILERAKAYEKEDVEMFLKRAEGKAWKEWKRVGMPFGELAEKKKAKVLETFSEENRRKAIEDLRTSFFIQLRYLMNKFEFENTIKLVYYDSVGNAFLINLNDYAVEVGRLAEYNTGYIKPTRLSSSDEKVQEAMNQFEAKCNKFFHQKESE